MRVKAPAHLQPLEVDVLAGAVFSQQEFAHACGMSLAWVLARVEAGVLQVETVDPEWRFDSVMLIRARRVARLEATNDADPELAALTADLIEEVTRLRQRLRATVGPGPGPGPDARTVNAVPEKHS